MSLFEFGRRVEEKKETPKVVKRTENYTISETGSERIYNIKTIKGLYENEEEMFFSPTTRRNIAAKGELEEFFKLSKQMGVEGVMVKNLEASYKAGLRVGTMAKLKELQEDLDLVILKAEYGKGKRSGYYSSFIMGVRNEDYKTGEERFLEVGKVSSGIKELESIGATLSNLTRLLKPLKVKEEKSIVYFTPKIILQVRYQEIQKSKTTTSKYALRFPRIISLREDKMLDEINSIEDIEKIVSVSHNKNL